MKEIKVNIADCADWWDKDFESNYFIRFLSKKYKVIRSDNPDYLLCSVHGIYRREHFRYRCIKILFSGENFTPDFNLYDYALGFDFLNFGDRYLRYPLWMLYSDALKAAENKHKDIDEDQLLNRDFCSFVVSNGEYADGIRERFFDELSKVSFVTSGGRFRNNIGYRVKDKHQFLKQYKFNIAFENSKYPGYCTEKLIEALAAQTVPIYWGAGGGDIINPKSYIDINSFPNISQAIEFIREVQHDKKLYLQILKEPAFLKENAAGYYEEKLEKFFDNIFEKDIMSAKKIDYVMHRRFYFEGWLWHIKAGKEITRQNNTIFKKIIRKSGIKDIVLKFLRLLRLEKPAKKIKNFLRKIF